ncbi:hypothetical protein [Streptomyces sp. T028]|uniref:hypothetical protein n=1 Tax=Streptomyces sp. T028 TaxID=3394379 RepID=UPI003A88EA6F
MDQGVAGVIAGIAGLVGAGVGGLATAYGARIGAQKTIEAAHMQVERQSTAEHLHWIREQRRQVYSDVLAAHASFRTTTINWLVELRRDLSLSSEDRLRFRGQYVELGEITARADLWGPRAVVDHGHAMLKEVGTQFVALTKWSEAIREGQSSDIPNLSQEFEAARAALKNARSAFMQAAVDALQY